MASIKKVRDFLVVLFSCALISNVALAAGISVGPGEKLRITIDDWHNISGEYRVSPSGTLSLPLIGDVKVGEADTIELARKIVLQLGKKINLEKVPHCSVEVVEFRPFFVMGDVTKAGKYEYVPGLTVLQAVSIAGGYFRGESRVSGKSLEGDVLVLQRQTKELLAKVARLEAEKANKTTIDFPDNLKTTAPSDQRLMQGEQDILRAHNESHAKKIKAFEKHLALLNEEFTSIDSQIEISQKQLKLLNQRFENVRKLAKGGLTTMGQRVVAEASRAQMELQVQRITSRKLGVRQSISHLEQRRLDLITNRVKRINQDLQLARSEAEKTSYKLAASQALFFGTSFYNSKARKKISVNFEIQRRTKTSPIKIVADSDSTLLPGDVLIVKRDVVPESVQSLQTDARDGS